jgi:hypothetical protein
LKRGTLKARRDSAEIPRKELRQSDSNRRPSPLRNDDATSASRQGPLFLVSAQSKSSGHLENLGPARARERKDRAMSKIRCGICGNEVVSTFDAYRKVTGWVKPRVAGGTNAIALKEETGEVAHAHCVELEKAGVTPDQLTLV